LVRGIATPLARGAWDGDGDGGLGIAKVTKGNVARMNAEKYICENEWRTVLQTSKRADEDC
jgi:hypothetical protein